MSVSKISTYVRALKEYRKKTGKDLTAHPLVAQIGKTSYATMSHHREKRSAVIYDNLNNLWTIIDTITLSPIA